MLTGLRAEVTFYKALMDKIGAQADFLKMGDFKSAVEPYTRTSMSESSRKQLETVLDDFFHQSIIQRIVTLRAGRKFSSEQVRTFIDQGPYTAKRAMELGFSYCGIAKAKQLDEDAKRLEAWLNKGMHGKMQYMENHFDLRIDPSKLVPGAKSVITLLKNY